MSEEDYFDDEQAAAQLLMAGVLFVSGGYQSKSDSLELAVPCNDVFWWGTADAEPCKPGELQSLYDAWQANPKYGSTIWCCRHRGLQPQKPVRERMQQAGVWTAELEALKDPGPS